MKSYAESNLEERQKIDAVRARREFGETAAYRLARFLGASDRAVHARRIDDLLGKMRRQAASRTRDPFGALAAWHAEQNADAMAAKMRAIGGMCQTLGVDPHAGLLETVVRLECVAAVLHGRDCLADDEWEQEIRRMSEEVAVGKETVLLQAPNAE